MATAAAGKGKQEREGGWEEGSVPVCAVSVARCSFPLHASLYLVAAVLLCTEAAMCRSSQNTAVPPALPSALPIARFLRAWSARCAVLLSSGLTFFRRLLRRHRLCSSHGSISTCFLCPLHLRATHSPRLPCTVSYASAEPSKHGRNAGPRWLRYSAILLPLATMGHGIGKIVYMEMVSDGPYVRCVVPRITWRHGLPALPPCATALASDISASTCWRDSSRSEKHASWRISQALVALAIVFSLAEAIQSTRIGAYIRRTRTAVLLLAGVIQIRGQAERFSFSFLGRVVPSANCQSLSSRTFALPLDTRVASRWKPL